MDGDQNMQALSVSLRNETIKITRKLPNEGKEFMQANLIAIDHDFVKATELP